MKRILPYIVITLISLVALKPIWSTPFLYSMHDQVQGERVFQMAQAIALGQFPVRIVQDLGYGYGYPLFDYYAPLPYYMGATFYLLGFNAIIATKLMISLGFILSGITMYFLCSKIWNKWASLLGAVFYLFAPYHAVQLYVRGSIGELYAYALLPLVVYTLIQIRYKESKYALYAGSILALFLLTHTISAYISALSLLLYVLITSLYLLKKDKNRAINFIKKNLLFIASGVGLSAFFILPALFEINYTNLSLSTGNHVNYRDHFVTLQQLWSSPWGYAGSAPGTAQDGMSFMLGKLLILCAVVSLITILLKKKFYTKKQKTITLALVLLTVITISLMLQFTQPLWQIIPGMQLIQFPWRFLTFATFSLSLLAPAFLYYITNITELSRYLYALLILAIIYTLLFPLNPNINFKTKYFETNGSYKMTANQITNREHLRYKASTISDEYLPQGVSAPSDTESSSHDKVTCYAPCLIKSTTFTPTKYTINLLTAQKTAVFIDKAYFPEVTVTIDGKKGIVDKGENNFIGTLVNTKGEHTIVFQRKSTLLQTTSNIISLLTALILLVWYYKSTHPDRHPKSAPSSLSS